MHTHNHGHNHSREQNIKIAALLNISFTVIEIVGGLWTNSLAILSDALHDFGDSVALLFSLFAEKKAKQPADSKRTYGYHRLSLFSALFAGIVLIGGSLFILSEAIPRLLAPEHTNAPGMIGLSIFGILINGFSVLRLKKGKSQNERILLWHMIEDVLGWVIILIGAIVIYFWDNHLIDPIMTIGFTTFVLWGAFRNIRETVNIFLQGTPSSINLEAIKKSIVDVQGVLKVHDVHVWSLEGETNVFSAHVVVEDRWMSSKKSAAILKLIKDILTKHHIHHSTIEIESDGNCSGGDCG